MGSTSTATTTPPGRNAKGDWQIVSDDAFEAMGTRLVRGRWFSATDTSNSAPVVVVNETMARTYWRDGNAVGGRVGLGGANSSNPYLTVVGIVADERHNGVTGIVKEKFYVPHSQWHVATGGNLIRNVFVVVRTTGEPMSVAGAVRAAGTPDGSRRCRLRMCDRWPMSSPRRWRRRG